MHQNSIQSPKRIISHFFATWTHWWVPLLKSDFTLGNYYIHELKQSHQIDKSVLGKPESSWILSPVIKSAEHMTWKLIIVLCADCPRHWSCLISWSRNENIARIDPLEQLLHTHQGKQATRKSRPSFCSDFLKVPNLLLTKYLFI